MVDLVPMTKEQFHAYLGFAIANYAQENVRAGNLSADTALNESAHQFQQLLPDGLDTPDQYLYAIYSGQEQHVGYLWFGPLDEGGRAFAVLYDIVIFDPYRRRGYGLEALQVLEQRVKSRGLGEIRLRVFGHNQAARGLYEKLGYVATNITMAKPL